MTHCVFCGIVAGTLPASIVYDDEHAMALMDIVPLRPAHVLVILKRHAQHVYELTDDERNHLFAVANQVGCALRASAFQPVALHFNINDGKAAQQTVPHVHLHVLPRYRNDMLSFAGSLLAKPVRMLTGGVSRAILEQQAQEIRRHLR